MPLVLHSRHRWPPRQPRTATCDLSADASHQTIARAGHGTAAAMRARFSGPASCIPRTEHGERRENEFGHVENRKRLNRNSPRLLKQFKELRSNSFFSRITLHLSDQNTGVCIFRAAPRRPQRRRGTSRPPEHPLFAPFQTLLPPRTCPLRLRERPSRAQATLPFSVLPC